MKKLTSLVFAALMCFVTAAPASAISVAPATPKEPADYGAPVKESTYYDKELDAKVTERIYFVPDRTSVSAARSKSGNGWYKNERTFDWAASDNTTTTYAKGYFVWGDGDVSVSSPSGGYDWFPSASTITEKGVTSGTSRYGYVFNKFAYVTYTFKFTTQFGGIHDLTVTIRVSESGNLI